MRLKSKAPNDESSLYHVMSYPLVNPLSSPLSLVIIGKSIHSFMNYLPSVQAVFWTVLLVLGIQGE